jgi:hypothetical protein
VWAVKYPPFPKQSHANAGTFPLRYFRAKLFEQTLNVTPLQVRAGWMQKEQFKCFSVFALH